MSENSNDSGDHNPEKEHEKDSNIKSKTKNGFAISQTLAPMSLDLGLLTSNINQLRNLISKGSDDNNIYTINITLISVSIVLQTTVAILITINYFNLREARKYTNATNINTAISTISIFISAELQLPLNTVDLSKQVDEWKVSFFIVNGIYET